MSNLNENHIDKVLSGKEFKLIFGEQFYIVINHDFTYKYHMYVDGLNLCLNVGASLIVAIALLYFVNFGFGWLSSMIERFAHYPIELSVERIVGFLVWPFVWMLGIPSKLIGLVSGIVGLKIAINEMIAYTALVDIEISGLIKILLTYVLCGFTNFSSIGIQLGGIGAMEPSIKDTIAKLGMKALCASICVNFLIAFIIGLLLD